jgi:hypothetical protein
VIWDRGITMEKTRNIPKDRLKLYFKRVHNSIHKLLYLKEENCATLDECIESFLDELYGAENVCGDIPYFIQLIFNVQSLKYCIDDYKKFRSRIFKCENICDSIYKNMGE